MLEQFTRWNRLTQVIPVALFLRLCRFRPYFLGVVEHNVHKLVKALENEHTAGELGLATPSRKGWPGTMAARTIIFPSIRCSTLSKSHTSTRVPDCKLLKITFYKGGSGYHTGGTRSVHPYVPTYANNAGKKARDAGVRWAGPSHVGCDSCWAKWW